MKRRYLLRIAVLVALLMILAVIGILAGLALKAARGSPRNTVVLADGSRFTLLGAAPGDQRFTTEKPWQKTARRWLPRRWQGWLPDVISASGGGGSNALSVFFTLLDARGATVTALPWNWFAAVADDGFQFSVSGGYGSSTLGRTTLFHLWLEAFPRRQSDFDLRLTDRNGQVVGSICVHNPFQGPFVEWTPDKLPIIRTNGPLMVTLESIAERSNATSPYSVWLAPKWKLETTDPLWRGATPSYQQRADATGNQGGRLAYEERAWKLQLPFRRPNPANYLDTEKFVLPGLPVPQPGTLQPLTNEFERMGVKFKIVCLFGSGTMALTNGVNFGVIASTASGNGHGTASDLRGTIETWTSTKPFFLIESSTPALLDDDLRFRVIGSDGNELPRKSNGSYYGSTAGNRMYQLEFDTTNGISNLALEGIVSRARLVEFTVDPAEVHRVGSGPK